MKPRLRQLLPAVATALNLVSLAVSAVWPAALLFPAVYMATLAAVSVTAAISMRSACGLLAGPALGIMHTAWGAGFLWHGAASLMGRTGAG